MKDTRLQRSGTNIHRLAIPAHAQGCTQAALHVFDDPLTGKYARPPVFENGSAGLVSTGRRFQRLRADVAQWRQARKRAHPVAAVGRD